MADLEHAELGRTGIRVSRICMGSLQAAGWATADEESFVATIRRGLDVGIDFIDTAAAYGDGAAERLVARAIAGRRQEVVLATKFRPEDSRPADVRRSLEGSLRRLRTDYVDLLQQHWPAPDVPLTETVGALERLVEEGLVRAVGVSNWMEPEWAELDDPGRVHSVQACHSLLWRSVERSVLPLCRERGIAVLAYSPLCQGVLAGRFRELDGLPPDARSRNRRLRPDVFPMVRDVVRALEVVARSYGRPSGQVALRWLLDRGATAAIVGASRPDQVAENAGALGWTLDAEAARRLDEVSWPLSAGLRPHDALWGWHSRVPG